MDNTIKNIWIINHYADPPNIGKFNRHFNFAKNLINKGYNVKIFTASTIHTTNINMISNGNTYKVDNYQGVDYVFVKAMTYNNNGYKRILNMMQYAYRVVGVTKKFDKPDLIIASSPHPLTWLAAYRIAKRNNCYFLTETRDLWPETFVAMGKMKKNSIPAKILYKIEREMYDRSDRIIFTLPGGAEYIENIGLDSNKVDYINNGIVLKDFNENITNSNYTDADLDDENNFNVIFTGAIGKANDLGRVIRAFEIIDRDDNNIKFLIFGDSGEREELEKYVKDKNIKNVIFKGRVGKKEIPAILNKSDLQILSLAHLPELFKYGLSPNKLFEYLAAGKPIISNVECGYDLLEKYNCGITVQGDSEQAMADGILLFYNMYMNNRYEYNKYCNNALKASEDFDFKILTEKLIESFDKLK